MSKQPSEDTHRGQQALALRPVLRRVRDGLLLSVFILGPALAGAFYRWLWPLLVGLILLAGALTLVDEVVLGAVRPRVAKDWLVLLVLGLVAYVLLQMIPLPRGVVGLLSPHRAADQDHVEQVLAAEAGGDEAPRRSWLPLTSAPGRTRDFFWLGLSYAVLLLLGLRFGASLRDLRRWYIVLGTVACILATVGLIRWLQIGGRLASTLGQANRAAGYFMLTLPLLVAVHRTAHAFGPRTALRVYGPFAAAIVVQIAFLLTISRWGIASAILSGTAVGVLFLRRRGRLAIGTAVALGCIVLLNILLLFQPLWSRYSLLFDTAGLRELGRPQAWRQSLGIVGDFPLFGAGAGSFKYVFPRYQSPELPGWFHQAHNDYLNLLCDLGLVGFLLAAAVLVLAVRRILPARRGSDSTRRWLVGAGLAACGAPLIHALADFDFQIPAIAMQFSFILGLTVSATDASSRSEVLVGFHGEGLRPSRSPPGGVEGSAPHQKTQQELVKVSPRVRWAAGVVAGLAVLALWPLGRLELAGRMQLAASMKEVRWGYPAVVPRTTHGWKQRARMLERARRLDGWHVENILAAAHVSIIIGDRQRLAQDREIWWERGRRMLQENLALCPLDGRAYFWLGYLAVRRGDPDAARVALAAAGRVWPANPILNERIARRLLYRARGQAEAVDPERLALAADALRRVVIARPQKLEQALEMLEEAGSEPRQLQRLAQAVDDGVPRLGRFLLRRGRLDTAARLLLGEHSGDAGGGRPEVHLLSCEALLRTGRFSAAKQEAARYVKRAGPGRYGPAAWEVWRLYKRVKLPRAGLAAIQEAQAGVPDIYAIELLPVVTAAARAGNDPATAARAVEQMLARRLRPDDLPIVAAAAEQLGNRQAAIKAWNEYVRQRPGYGAYLKLGRLYAADHEPRVALAYFNRALQLRGGAYEAAREKARALIAMGRKDRAIDELTRLTEHHPRQVDPYLTLARLYQQNYRKQAARDVLQRGFKHTGSPALVRALENLGE